MKRTALIGLALMLAVAVVPAAAQTTETMTRDLLRLQDDLVNLDDSLAALEPSHPREAELRLRADRIRERVDRLAADVRREGGAVRMASPEELRSLRRDINALQSDIDTALGRGWSTGTSAVLPEGTEIQVRLEESLSSKTARREDRFEATVALPLRDAQGRVAIPAGTRVRGIVAAVEEAERPARPGRLDLSFDTIYLDERTATPLRAHLVSVEENLDRSETGKRAGIGAVVGGVLGSLIGGTKGALIGAVLGGAGGVVATAGEEVTLPAGSILTLRLDRSLDVRR
ncbi:MAG TPA: hypothetical protein VMT87_08765 [Vicinamibacteria bacterium]|nr:hypothetical protein [Vicinamibacteria bacterium]